MSSPYRIKTIIASSGERLPLLLDRESGIPLFNPSAYMLTMARGRSRSYNTIKAHLTAIEVLLIYAQAEGIDLAERINTGRLLDLWEIDGLVAPRASPQRAGLVTAGDQEQIQLRRLPPEGGSGRLRG